MESVLYVAFTLHSSLLLHHGKKRTSEETLRKAKEKGAGRDIGIVDGKPHFKKIVLGTKNNYDRQVAFWHRFVQESLEENPDTPPPSPYDLRSLQHFVRAMAYAIDGAEGIDEGCTETVRYHVWCVYQRIWESEFAVQLTRDAKNMADTPEKRPQHALYEGAVPMILCFNPMLPFLARLLVHRAFRDYGTIEELLSIIPAEDEMLQLHWKDELLDAPFLKAQSTKDSEERIETADAFSKRHRAWGFALVTQNHRLAMTSELKAYTGLATRMVHAGHMDPNNLRRHYMPITAQMDKMPIWAAKGEPSLRTYFGASQCLATPNYRNVSLRRSNLS
ncbi:hypothetical protein LTR93_011817 [Exophiala xenobiotica]|nr:hypothetical protein LTR93_011817 [Exophiala xenobiotica]